MGIPVVATDVGGTRQLIAEGVTGYMVCVGDADKMAQTIIELVSDEEQRKKDEEGCATPYGRGVVVQKGFEA